MPGSRRSGASGPSTWMHSNATSTVKQEKTMNILLWVLQIAVAFLFISGGAYKVFKVETLAGHFRGLPPTAWRALGVIELVGGVLVVVPANVSGVPMLTALTAAVLAIESLALAAAYGRKSVK